VVVGNRRFLGASVVGPNMVSIASAEGDGVSAQHCWNNEQIRLEAHQLRTAAPARGSASGPPSLPEQVDVDKANLRQSRD
jgi:hypothetical protein